MKVKIFEYSSVFEMSVRDMEEDINEFIKDKKIIDIKYTSCAISEEKVEYLSALVIYEE